MEYSLDVGLWANLPALLVRQFIQLVSSPGCTNCDCLYRARERRASRGSLKKPPGNYEKEWVRVPWNHAYIALMMTKHLHLRFDSNSSGYLGRGL